MSKYNPKYTEEFKSQIVSLVKNGKEKKEIVKEYGISKTSLNLWVKYSNTTGSFKVKDNLSDTEKELIELKKQNKQLLMENDLLKQAALILGRR